MGQARRDAVVPLAVSITAHAALLCGAVWVSGLRSPADILADDEDRTFELQRVLRVDFPAGVRDEPGEHAQGVAAAPLAVTETAVAKDRAPQASTAANARGGARGGSRAPRANGNGARPTDFGAGFVATLETLGRGAGAGDANAFAASATARLGFRDVGSGLGLSDGPGVAAAIPLNGIAARGERGDGSWASCDGSSSAPSLAGIGCDGRGEGRGAGLGRIGFGRGAAPRVRGGGQGMCGDEPCHGLLAGSHFIGRPLVRCADDPETGQVACAGYVNGRLPPEVIQRVIRQSFGRFRGCYESALVTNPALQGRVAASFVIARDGAVSASVDAGSDLPDRGVVGCVVSAFGALSFPAPEKATVSVGYALAFSPE
jgi:hypothetical protein